MKNNDTLLIHPKDSKSKSWVGKVFKWRDGGYERTQIVKIFRSKKAAITYAQKNNLRIFPDDWAN